MSKNLIPQIAHMLGVELGEKFKIKGEEELTYRFDSDGLKLITHDSGIEIAKISANVAFAALVNGKDEIVKLPWKPMQGDVYYTFIRDRIDRTCTLVSYRWDGCVIDIALLKVGWVYRTRAEAAAALPAVAAEMGVEYKL